MCSATVKKLMSCVRPGVRDVLASFRLPVSALMALDLPALLRPAKATSHPKSAGALLSALADCKNSLLLKESFCDLLGVLMTVIHVKFGVSSSVTIMPGRIPQV